MTQMKGNLKSKENAQSSERSKVDSADRIFFLRSALLLIMVVVGLAALISRGSRLTTQETGLIVAVVVFLVWRMASLWKRMRKEAKRVV